MSPVIEVRQLHKSYGNTVAVDDVSFGVQQGEIGPDGAGKTTSVAIDTPASLAEGAETGQRIQFRPSVPLPPGLLESLPDVTDVIYRGDVVVVTGTSNALNAVTSALARNQILARQLRVDQANLEDAFLALTGRPPFSSGPWPAGRWPSD